MKQKKDLTAGYNSGLFEIKRLDPLENMQILEKVVLLPSLTESCSVKSNPSLAKPLLNAPGNQVRPHCV